MDRKQLAKQLRLYADVVEQGFEVDRGGLQIDDALAALRQIAGKDYFTLSLRITSYDDNRAPEASWEAYGFTKPAKTFEAPSLAALVDAVVNHTAEPPPIGVVAQELGRDASAPVVPF